MVAVFAYVGCYTTPDRDGRGKGIEVYEMDPKSGAWTHVQTLETIGNPSWQTVGPSGQHLYSVHGGDGFTQVSAYSIDLSSGKLTFLNAQECGSPNPVAISISPIAPYAVVAGYNAGKVSALPVNADGSLGPMSRPRHPRREARPAPHRAGPLAPAPHPDRPGRQVLRGAGQGVRPDLRLPGGPVERQDRAVRAGVRGRGGGRGAPPLLVPPERRSSPTSATRSTRR